MLYCTTVLLYYCATVQVYRTSYILSPARHHEPLSLVELEVDGARHVGDVAAQVEQVGARHRDVHCRHV